MLCCHTLQAIHQIIFIHKALLPLVTNVASSAVATGIANTLGNKGGIGISFNLGKTSMLFVNCHLTAHQHKEEDRNKDVDKIERGLKLPKVKTGKSHLPKASQRFDHVVWMGDLNYRVVLPRNEVDLCIKEINMPPLHKADQLQRLMRDGQVFDGFQEGDITFPPTYKLDAGTLQFDSSEKQRVPSWTDRVLFKQNPGIKQTSYNCSTDYQTSDHLPVYATFEVEVDSNDEDTYQNRGPSKYGQNKSQVCAIM